MPALKIADLEFVQFHPTALAGSARPMPLVSEAVRGEGAVLIDEHGQRFLAEQRGAELAPRDVVARAVSHRLALGHRVFLDARTHAVAEFVKRFPVISARCRMAGGDPATDPIPVRPAVHYHMGGIAVDAAGRSSIEGLWACGEVSRTGLHGANRLASNSLMEAVGGASGYRQHQGRRGGTIENTRDADAPACIRCYRRCGRSCRKASACCATGMTSTRYPWPQPIASGNGAASDPALVGLMIAVAAHRREESRGGHYRTDFPDVLPSAVPSSITLADALAAANEIVETTTLSVGSAQL